MALVVDVVHQMIRLVSSVLLVEGLLEVSCPYREASVSERYQIALSVTLTGA